MAIQDYDSALKLQPRSADLYLQRGMALISLKKYKDAISMFNRAIKFKPGYYHAYYSRGRARLEMKEFKTAILDFDTAVAIKPDFEIAYFTRGIAKLELNSLLRDAACADLRKAARLGYGEAYNYIKKYCE